MTSTPNVSRKKPKKLRVDTVDLLLRNKTFFLLQKMKDHCEKLIESTTDEKRKETIARIVMSTREAQVYLEANDCKSSVCLTRFFAFLTPQQRITLHLNKIRRLTDLANHSRNDLRRLLRQGNRSPSFLTILGS